MRGASLAAVMALASLGAAASPWTFAPPEGVTEAGGEQVFHHLESSGRRSIAVSDGVVAVAWEDNRDGVPRVYVAFRRPGAGFGPAQRVSGTGEAFEPAVIDLDGGRFLLAWEEGGSVAARVALAGDLGPAVTLSGGGAAQATLGRGHGRTYALWSERSGGATRVLAVPLAVRGLEVAADRTPCPVEAAAPAADQSYPSLAVVGEGLPLVAWEDRRRGHTVILWARGESECRFAPARPLYGLPQTRTVEYGRGSGAARVALAAFGSEGVAAVWSDKRNFRTGYDTFGAVSADGGRTFGPEGPVQDDFGDLTEQWRPAVTGNAAGTLAVAWDDNRDGTSDVWLAWREGGVWSENVALPGASGVGEQTHPALFLDPPGNLHVAWVERDQVGGPTRLRYAVGRAASASGGRGGPQELARDVPGR